MSGSRVAIQGFGAVGQAAAERLVELGATIVAVSTAAGAVHEPDGIDVARLARLRMEIGDDCVREYGGVQPADIALSVETDILVPAAREDVIDDAIAESTTARLVVEGANLPTNPSSRAVLHKRGVALVPDFIANCGGIIAAAHSMDARYSALPVEPAAIFTMISAKVRANVPTVLGESTTHEITPHEAATMLARQRVRKAMELRGQCPAELTEVTV